MKMVSQQLSVRIKASLTRINVNAVTIHPLVVVVFPAVKVDPKKSANHPRNGADAN